MVVLQYARHTGPLAVVLVIAQRQPALLVVVRDSHGEERHNAAFTYRSNGPVRPAPPQDDLERVRQVGAAAAAERLARALAVGALQAPKYATGHGRGELAVDGALVRGEAGTAAAVRAAGTSDHEGEAHVPAGHRR